MWSSVTFNMSRISWFPQARTLHSTHHLFTKISHESEWGNHQTEWDLGFLTSSGVSGAPTPSVQSTTFYIIISPSPQSVSAFLCIRCSKQQSAVWEREIKNTVSCEQQETELKHLTGTNLTLFTHFFIEDFWKAARVLICITFTCFITNYSTFRKTQKLSRVLWIVKEFCVDLKFLPWLGYFFSNSVRQQSTFMTSQRVQERREIKTNCILWLANSV